MAVIAEANWRTRILLAGEQRYIESVIRPALEDLEAARANLTSKMPDAETGDSDVVALFESEIERVNAMEARLRGHMSDTTKRFARRSA